MNKTHFLHILFTVLSLEFPSMILRTICMFVLPLIVLSSSCCKSLTTLRWVPWAVTVLSTMPLAPDAT